MDRREKRMDIFAIITQLLNVGILALLVVLIVSINRALKIYIQKHSEKK